MKRQILLAVIAVVAVCAVQLGVHYAMRRWAREQCAAQGNVWDDRHGFCRLTEAANTRPG